LSDLARRENRFARDNTQFPHAIDLTFLSETKMGASDGFSGDDILLTDIAGFDVKIYSPTVRIDLIDIDSNGSAETAVEPSHIGYVGVGANAANNGGFVDLATNPAIAFTRTEPFFTTFPLVRAALWTEPTYCTWSPHYETDGIDQDQDGFSDEGANGLDDDDANGVDDDGERETAPPYPFPVRGIEVTFRIIEKNTRQVRQTSVIQNFLPQ
jgi:hypothetical protein